jgi:hypothetical protein
MQDGGMRFSFSNSRILLDDVTPSMTGMERSENIESARKEQNKLNEHRGEMHPPIRT